MLRPAMTQILKNNESYYSLVVAVAKRARQIAEEAEMNEIKLTEKPVKMALDDIVSGRIVNITRTEEPDEAASDSER